MKGVKLLTKYMGAPMQDEFKKFYDELKDCYKEQNQRFNWDWNTIEKLSSNSHLISQKPDNVMKDFLYYIAFNLSKNILHGPLPNHIHTRMVLDKSNWCKKYIEYLEAK